MTENGKNAKTGGGLYGVLGVGQCVWPIGRGAVFLAYSAWVGFVLVTDASVV